MYSPGVRLIVWICVVVYVLQHVYFPDVDSLFGLSYIGHHNFKIFQCISYGFLHGGVYHILVNMCMLAMFGSRLEYTLGRRNFLFLFLISVAGGAILQTIANMVTINAASGMYFPLDTTSDPVGRVQFTLDHGFEVTNVFTGITIGASAGVFGCMVAFACLFPYQRLSLFLIPISVSARLLIILYFVLEVYNGISTSTSHIAHFAHLGGALFGFLMTRYWKKTMFL